MFPFPFAQLERQLLSKAGHKLLFTAARSASSSILRNPKQATKYLNATTSLLQKRHFFMDTKNNSPKNLQVNHDDLAELQKVIDDSLSTTKLDETFLKSTKTTDVQHTINETLRGDLHTAAIRLFTLEKFVNVMLPPVARKPSLLYTLLHRLVSLIIFFAIFSFVGTKIRGAIDSSDGFYDVFDPSESPEKNVLLSEVKGIDSIVDELGDVIDMINNPQKYAAIGATIPRGILLTGPPGTGKTMLAKAIASECGVKFYSLSASSLETGFIGGGASNIRALFQAARNEGRCIIFIDELDSIMSRNSSQNLFNGRYVMQTLNALLVEMDGFTPDQRVTVIAATNFPQNIDDALKRPGRFDLQVHVPMPDLNGRIDVLKSYIKKIIVSPTLLDEDIRTVAKNAAGQSPAFLRDLVNTAALVAAKRVISENIWRGTHVPVTRQSAEDISKRIEKAQQSSYQRLLSDKRESIHEYLSQFSLYNIIRESLGYKSTTKYDKDLFKEDEDEYAPSILELPAAIRMRYEEDANAFFAEYDPKISALVAELQEIEDELSREQVVFDPKAIRSDLRWLRVFGQIRDERERVLKEQNLTPGVTFVDLERARDILSLGVKRTGYYNAAFDEDDRARVALARISAAITAINTPACDKVSKVTILPRGEKLGGIMLEHGSAQHQSGDDENDATSISHDQLLGRIRVALSPRIAEDIIYGHDGLSNESSEGLRQAYDLAQNMVTKWGFSQRTGMMAILYPEHLSQKNKELFDEEISVILKEQQQAVRELLDGKKNELVGLSKLLIREETIHGDQITQFLDNYNDMNQLNSQVTQFNQSNTINNMNISQAM